ncbi:DNA starvation/stationary phase protection protein [Mesomycoplasma ovipneumoniae]|uniref:Dps family protein n=1 Tax=Mesomycoplasma ovipneumoniae TaxID=29562 RepID=UPI0030803A1B
MITKLNKLQANLTVLYTNLKNFHWNLQDVDFLVIHKYTDKLAKKTIEFVDEVAEKIRSLGQIAISSFDEISQNSDLEIFNSKIWTSEIALEKIGKQIKLILEVCKNIQQDESNFEIQHLIFPLIDELVLYYHKELWIIHAQKSNN